MKFLQKSLGIPGGIPKGTSGEKTGEISWKTPGGFARYFLRNF